MEEVQEHAGATTLELFFDLVFVFALTQVTAFMAADLSPHGFLRGVLILAIVWWCWVGYSWVSNVVKADEGATTVAIFVAMAAMFVISLTIPESFNDLEGGLSGPTTFAVAYLVVRAVHLALFIVASKGDPDLRRQLALFSTTMVGATALLLIAAQTQGSTQTLLWAAALVVDYGGTFFIGNRGWRINSAKHFAERHGLIIIVALGESIVAIGVGVAQLPVSWPIVVASVLGLSISASLWWAYFDVAALRAEHHLTRAQDHHRVAMAQVAYTYLHLPMLVGIVLIALGLKKVLEYVGDQEHHRLSDPLTDIALWALFGGVALYLLSHAAFGKRTYGEVSSERVTVALLLVLLTPVAGGLPALASLGLVALPLVGLNLFESFRHRHLRHEVRHQQH